MKKLRERGQAVPFLDNMPKLDPADIHFLEAFRALSETRPTNVTPIPFSEIGAYLTLLRIVDEVEVQDYIYLIRSLDRLFVAHSHKINEQKRRDDERRAQQR